MEYRARTSILFLALLAALVVSKCSGQAPHPAVMVRNASPEQIARLERAIAAFTNAGLDLPDLEIEFMNEDACAGAHGRFRATNPRWQIRICSADLGFVYEHELAHAWEQANLTDEQRQAFLELRGYTNWSDHDRPRNERGVERVALVLQQGLAGLALPPVLGAEAVSRLEDFELLAGRPAPVLEAWMDSKDVPCDVRPTAMSMSLPDRSELTCKAAVVEMQREESQGHNPLVSARH